MESYVLCNSGGSAVSVDIELIGTVLDDPYLIVYSGTSIPSDPTMCLAVDDDSGTAALDSLVTSVPIPAGGAVTVVASSYEYVGSGYEYGAFDWVVTRL